MNKGRAAVRAKAPPAALKPLPPRVLVTSVCVMSKDGTVVGSETRVPLFDFERCAGSGSDAA